MVFKYNCHLDKHLSRKFPCFTNIPTVLTINSNLEKDTKYPINVVQNHQPSVKNPRKDVQNPLEVDKNDAILFDKNPYSCDKCGKHLSSISYKKKHEAKCNGLNSLQCLTCHKWFSSASTKSEHRRNVKCSPPKPLEPSPKPNVVRKKITTTVKLQIGASQSWRCNICHNQLKSTYHIDHIIQICRGGTNVEDNLQALCVECHAHKTQRERQV